MWAQIDPRVQGVSGTALRLGYVYAALAAILYLLGNEPAATVDDLPPARLDAWMWTPLIPIFIAAAVACFVLTGAGEMRNLRRSHIAAVSICVVLTQSAQLAIASPVGPDGWYFTELSWRFVEHGPAATIDGYLVRPIALLPLIPFAYISPGATLFVASAIAIGLSVVLFHVLLRPLHTHPAASAWLPLWGAGLAGIAIAWWNPAQYSAQAYALIAYAWLLHHRLEHSWRRIDGLAWLVIAVSAATHLVTPMLLTVILLIEGRGTTARAAKARQWSMVMIASWALWNGFPAWRSTSAVIGITGLPDARWMFLAGGAAFVAILWIDHLRSDRPRIDEVGVHPGPPGIDTASLLIGLGILSPVLLLQDISIGAPRLTGRLVLYAAVPLGWWLLGLPERTGVERWVLELPQPRRVALVGVIAIVIGAIMASGHLSLVNRTLVSTPAAADCWDLVETSGVWALEDYSQETILVLYGHPHVPPTVESRFFFVRLGDGGLTFEVEENGSSPYGAVLVTSDVPERLDRYAPDGFTDNWTTVDSIDRVCHVKVRPDLVPVLDPEVGPR